MTGFAIRGHRISWKVLVPVALFLLLLLLMYGQLLVPRSVGQRTGFSGPVPENMGRPVFSQGVPPADPGVPPTP